MEFLDLRISWFRFQLSEAFEPLDCLWILNGRARFDLFPTYHVLDCDFDLLPIDGDGKVGNGNDKFWHVSRRQFFSDRSLDLRSQFVRQSKPGLHDKE